MSFAIPTLADAIALVQAKANDTITSHRVAPDDLSEYVDGTRTVFPMAKKNIVTGNATCNYIKDGGALTALDPTDGPNGIFTLSPAPTKTLELYYYYTNFTYSGAGNEMQGFVDQALLEMGFTELNLSPDGVLPATIPGPLFLAMGFLGASYAGKVLMDRFAENFNATVEGTALQESEIYKAYRASYQDNIKEGLRIREEYWGGQTRSKLAYSASKGASYRGFRSMPRR